MKNLLTISTSCTVHYLPKNRNLAPSNKLGIFNTYSDSPSNQKIAWNRPKHNAKSRTVVNKSLMRTTVRSYASAPLKSLRSFYYPTLQFMNSVRVAMNTWQCICRRLSHSARFCFHSFVILSSNQQRQWTTPQCWCLSFARSSSQKLMSLGEELLTVCRIKHR
jgi:hypothetical protein